MAVLAMNLRTGHAAKKWSCEMKPCKNLKNKWVTGATLQGIYIPPMFQA